jgi:S-DNA-T family DNA segregation ATPase FtsK/SpoIIIE
MKQEYQGKIVVIFLIGLTLLVGLSVVSYSPSDLGFYTSHPRGNLRNLVGIVGAYLSHILFFLFGWSSYLIPPILIMAIMAIIYSKFIQNFWIKILSSLILLIMCSTLFSLTSISQPVSQFSRGGLSGFLLSGFLMTYFAKLGSYLIVTTLIILSILLTSEFLILPKLLRLLFRFKVIFKNLSNLRLNWWLRTKTRSSPHKIKATSLPKLEKPKIKETLKVLKKREKILVQPSLAEKGPTFSKKEEAGYRFPPLNLLDSPPPIEQRKIKDNLEANSKILEGTLSDFGIEVRVTQVERGPIITRYELQPAAGVKVHRITELSDDIALAMKAHSVRIVAPIPGKARVGVEVPNTTSTLVYLREILESESFQNSTSKLTLCLGKDISGVPLVSDLGELPHLLIAGTTGSGKTVCVNALISSILFKAQPEEVKFVMVDPKMVELAVFNELPHLLCPVVTDVKKVSGALSWVVGEMERRYQLLAKRGVRNIDIYNEKFPEIERIPYIVVIIDELADLMAVASRDIENAITRLAQLSRAVGIHIILATQRPSVDVVTGVIKANFPARISFRVASKVDSRTVLDMNGADKLLGKGDMLFLKPGTSKPIRAQGSLIEDKEIEGVVKFIKSQRKAQYNEQILQQQEKKVVRGEWKDDEFFDEAVKMILETKQASVSMLQRRLGLGYTRAARLIDMMEERKIVGPYCGSKPRKILIESYEEIKKSEDENGVYRG